MNVIDLAQISFYSIDSKLFGKMDDGYLDPVQVAAVKQLSGITFDRKWKLANALAKSSPSWIFKEKVTVNKMYNKHLKSQLSFLFRLFTIESPLNDMADDKKKQSNKIVASNS